MQQIDPMPERVCREPLDAAHWLARHGLPAGVGGFCELSPEAALVRWLMTGAEALAMDVPALCLGGARANVLVALAHEHAPLDDILRLRFIPGSVSDFCPGAAGGLIGVLSYDDMEKVAYCSGARVCEVLGGGENKACPAANAPSFVRQVLIAVEAPADRRTAVLRFSPDRRRDALSRLDGFLDAAARLAGQSDFMAGIQRGAVLRPERSDKDHVDAVRRVIDAVREGRWYQLNLLRFLRLEFTDGEAGQPVRQDAPPPGWFAWRMDTAGGEWSSLLDGPVGRIVSFSPERFTAVDPDRDGASLRTFPVKGTIARNRDPVQDAANANWLASSRKDLAELHMIVDLMRNDFHRVALPGSVKVTTEQMIRSHANVHHLHAEVTARIGKSVSLGDLLGAICPAGSITGTPKMEVIRGIREFEGRRRGYHMGNVFHWRPDGSFDSSVLIRTVASVPGGTATVPGSHGAYELAAGSGIVVHSEPESELAEVMAKARIVSAPLNQLSG